MEDLGTFVDKYGTKQKGASMNIGLFIKDFAVGKKFSKNGVPVKSGAEFHGENHALQLIKRGHHVTIMAKKRYWFTKARENINGIDLVRLHAPFRWLEIILRLLTTHRHLDAFYILGVSKFSVWAIVLAHLLRKPVTMSLTISEEVFYKDKGWRNKIFASCDHYIAISNEICEKLVEKSGVERKKITVLGQGIDTAKYSVISKEEKIKLRRNSDISESALVVLFCARIVMRKGVDTVQKVWRKIYDKFPTAKLVLVGGGENNIIEEFKKLSVELNNSIIIVGEVDNPCMYYQMADIYFLPSRCEGLPTTLMEAMSCGLPSIVSDIGGCNDLVSDDINGYVVDSEDVQGFYEKMCILLNEGSVRKRMRCEAIKFSHEKCDYKQVIGRLEYILANAKYITGNKEI